MNQYFQHKEIKKKNKECFCALCSTRRVLKYSRNLSSRNYGQIFMLTFGIVAVTYPWLAWKGVMSLPIVWAVFECIHKSLYRRELPCPHCGFDATWYKKDVKFARQKVEEFLKQNPDAPIHKRRAPRAPSSSIRFN